MSSCKQCIRLISVLISLAIQSPSIVGISATSITLQWSEPPPVLTGIPHRIITHYVVTVVDRDRGDSLVNYVLAEAGIVYNITGLRPTKYDIKVEHVIDTDGQGEQTYDLESPLLSVTTTSSEYNVCKNSNEKNTGLYKNDWNWYIFPFSG